MYWNYTLPYFSGPETVMVLHQQFRTHNGKSYAALLLGIRVWVHSKNDHFEPTKIRVVKMDPKRWRIEPPDLNGFATPQYVSGV